MRMQYANQRTSKRPKYGFAMHRLYACKSPEITKLFISFRQRWINHRKQVYFGNNHPPRICCLFRLFQKKKTKITYKSIVFHLSLKRSRTHFEVVYNLRLLFLLNFNLQACLALSECQLVMRTKLRLIQEKSLQRKKKKTQTYAETNNQHVSRQIRVYTQLSKIMKSTTQESNIAKV